MDGQRPELTYTERTVIESIKRGVPDAEIAVRLGIPITDVKNAVERLKLRYRVDQRAALATIDLERDSGRPQEAASSPGGEPPPVVPADQTPREPTVAPPPLPIGRGDDEPAYSRRALLVMIGVGAATLAGIGAYYLTGRDDSGRSPARADPFATNTPPPTPTPHPGVSAIGKIANPFAEYHFERNEPITLPHGMCFMDTASGDVTCYASGEWEAGAPVGSFDYRASPGNRFVAAFSRGRSWTVLDRESGRAWQWPASLLDLSVLGDRRIVLQEMGGEDAPTPGLPRIHVLDGEFQEVFALESEDILRGDGRLAPDGVLSADERWYLPNRYWKLRTPMRILDLDTGDIRETSLVGALGGPEIEVLVPAQHPGDTFALMTMRPMDTEDSRTGVPTVRYFHYDFDWNGSFQFHMPVTGQGWGVGSSRSPDGSAVVTQQAFRAHNFQRLGSQGENWTLMLVTDDEGEPLFRVRSGALQTIDWSLGRTWLADSSGFVAMVGEITDDGGLDTGYAVIDVATGELRPIPPPAGAWRDDWSANLGLIAAPDNADLVAVGLRHMFNLRTGEYVSPPVSGVFGALPVAPWGRRSDQMRFAFTDSGARYNFMSATLLPAKVEYPPFDDRMLFVVARTEDCLSVRDFPAERAGVRYCLPEGTVLELEPLDSGREVAAGIHGFPPVSSALHFNDDERMRYARVGLGDGRHGWVPMRNLDWA